jgi:hypothetical protein
MQHGPAASSGSNPKAPGSAGGYLLSAQIRAARGLIRWSAEDLARETALSVRAELTEEETSMTDLDSIG